jgi:hypothetical protein
MLATNPAPDWQFNPREFKRSSPAFEKTACCEIDQHELRFLDNCQFVHDGGDG